MAKLKCFVPRPFFTFNLFGMKSLSAKNATDPGNRNTRKGIKVRYSAIKFPRLGLLKLGCI